MGRSAGINAAMAVELRLLPLLCSSSIPGRSVGTHREEQLSFTFFTYRTNTEARKFPVTEKAV